MLILIFLIINIIIITMVFFINNFMPLSNESES